MRGIRTGVSQESGGRGFDQVSTRLRCFCMPNETLLTEIVPLKMAAIPGNVVPRPNSWSSLPPFGLFLPISARGTASRQRGTLSFMEHDSQKAPSQGGTGGKCDHVGGRLCPIAWFNGALLFRLIPCCNARMLRRLNGHFRVVLPGLQLEFLTCTGRRKFGDLFRGPETG
jgi:hypothetical protein